MISLSSSGYLVSRCTGLIIYLKVQFEHNNAPIWTQQRPNNAEVRPLSTKCRLRTAGRGTRHWGTALVDASEERVIKLMSTVSYESICLVISGPGIRFRLNHG